VVNETRVVSSAWWTLRLTLGIAAFVSGLDKFFNVIVHWSKYIAPVFERMLPFSPTSFMYIVGVIEMIVGVMILFSPWQRLFGWIFALWFWSIALNVLLAGFFDIAVRDIIIGITGATFAQLSLAVPAEKRAKLTPHVRARAPVHP
jgi:uncharacterized membrane protein YphA (DoxX/SURF4 family)